MTMEKTMVRSLAEIHAEQKALAEEEKKALKAHKAVHTIFLIGYGI